MLNGNDRPLWDTVVRCARLGGAGHGDLRAGQATATTACRTVPTYLGADERHSCRRDAREQTRIAARTAQLPRAAFGLQGNRKQ